MKKVKLVKVMDLEDKDPFEGYEFSKPRVGSCYLVLSKNLCRARRTSTVLEIINKNEFKTENSHFKITYL